MKYPKGCIVLFSRTPVPGKVKTRLARSVGDRIALQTHKRLMEMVARRCFEARLCPVELWLDEVPRQDEFVTRLCDKYQMEMQLQQGSDLGDKMKNAINKVLQAYDYTLVIGSDCPLIEARYLEEALSFLHSENDDDSMVLGPAEDGGYVLIGLRSCDDNLFGGIDWGTGHVLEQTRAIARRLNRPVYELPTLWDIDTEKDLFRLQKAFPGWAAE